MKSNQQSHDLAVAKALYLERLKLGMVDKAETDLSEYLTLILAGLTLAVSQTDFATMSKGELRSLIKNFRDVEREARPAFRARLVKLLREFAELEAGLARDLWADETDPEPITQADHDKNWIAIWTSILGGGATLANYTESFLDGIATKTETVINNGFALRLPVAEVLTEIATVPKVSKPKLATVVNTGTAATTGTLFDRYASSDRYVWSSIIDSRTSETCLELDGRIFLVGRGPRPPAHPNCRSTTYAYYGEDGGPVAQTDFAGFLKKQSPEMRNALTSNAPLSLEQYEKKVRDLI